MSLTTLVSPKSQHLRPFTCLRQIVTTVYSIDSIEVHALLSLCLMQDHNIIVWPEQHEEMGVCEPLHWPYMSRFHPVQLGIAV
jgi:hypothetical protein